MYVPQCYSVQRSHEQLALWVDEQRVVWNGRSITTAVSDLFSIGMKGVQIRVAAVAYTAFWSISEAVLFVPRLASLAIISIINEPTMYQAALRIADTYKTIFQATVLQASSYIAAMTLPELFYGQFQGHKTLFLHHANAFIEAMPDLPDIYDAIYSAYGINYFDSLAKVWLDLGFTKQQWKADLKAEFVQKWVANPLDGTELLNTERPLLIKCLFSAFIQRIVPEFNRQATLGPLTTQLAQNLDGKSLAWIYGGLQPATRSMLFHLRPDLETSLEANVGQVGVLFELLTDYRFRAPQTVRLSRFFLEKMIEARDELLREQMLTAMQVESYEDIAMSAITCRAILKFVLSARLSNDDPPHFIIQFRDGTRACIIDDQQFFKSREKLVQLYGDLQTLTPGERSALRCRLLFQDKITHALYNAANVVNCYRSIVRIRTELFDRSVMANDKLRDEDQTCWHDVYSLPESDVC